MAYLTNNNFTVGMKVGLLCETRRKENTVNWKQQCMYVCVCVCGLGSNTFWHSAVSVHQLPFSSRLHPF